MTTKALGDFKDSAAFSLGVELELQLVSKRDFDLTRGATDLLGSLDYDERFGEIKLEITESMIEISTQPQATVDGIAADLGGLRDTLRLHCERNNIGVCGGGTHPFHHWPERRICPGDRFNDLYQRYGYLAKQFTVFGQHVHVGCTSADEAIWLTQALGVHVPAFIALSASSPFVDGVDSFYQSARLNAVSAFPLSGQCPPLGSWQEFTEHFAFLQACGIAQGIKDLYWDGKLNTLTISTPLTVDEAETLKASVTSETAAAAIVEAAEVSRTTAIEFFQTPAELGKRFSVPQLALRIQGELVLFDDPEVLEYPWDLSPYDAAPTADDLSALGAGLKVSEGGEIDVDDASGRVVSRFLPDLQRDLGLVYQPENWDEVRLATWLCRNLPEQALTHASKQAFVAAWLTDLLSRDDVTLARANLQKFLIRNRLEARLRDLRKQAVGKAFQQTLLSDDAASRVVVSDQFSFDFHPQAYAPSRDYDPRTSAYGYFDFRHHYYGRIGDFDSKEEFECACQLDIWVQQGRIQFWVRNLVQREGSSFFLQKADGRFYPDFLCQLPGTDDQPGPILAVEYKGADRWLSAEDDRLIGGLWANLSEGRCRFVMIKDKRWDGIEAHLG